jgi:hypothetical protein
VPSETVGEPEEAFSARSPSARQPTEPHRNHIGQTADGSVCGVNERVINGNR